jgi:hypothetical protein
MSYLNKFFIAVVHKMLNIKYLSKELLCLVIKLSCLSFFLPTSKINYFQNSLLIVRMVSESNLFYEESWLKDLI